jgi:hypothetical protein
MRMSLSAIYDRFISYADVDLGWVEGYLLPALGVSSKRVIIERHIKIGSPVIAGLERVTSRSRYILLMVSPAGLVDESAPFSEQLASHVSVAKQHDCLIPLMLEACALPLRVEFRVQVECAGAANGEAEFMRLCAPPDRPQPTLEHILCPTLAWFLSLKQMQNRLLAGNVTSGICAGACVARCSVSSALQPTIS